MILEQNQILENLAGEYSTISQLLKGYKLQELLDQNAIAITGFSDEETTHFEM